MRWPYFTNVLLVIYMPLVPLKFNAFDVYTVNILKYGKINIKPFVRIVILNFYKNGHASEEKYEYILLQ